MTNVYVNLISTLDLSDIARIQKTTPYCKYIHEKVLTECGCIDRGNQTSLEMMDTNIRIMNNELHKLAQKWNTFAKKERTDLAFVVQSYMEGIGPTLDIDFLNKLDCFHPSTLGHELLATGLWNSMLCNDQNGGRKNRCGVHFDKSMQALCPTKESVFYTGDDVIPGPPPY
jgi:phospholipase B1